MIESLGYQHSGMILHCTVFAKVIFVLLGLTGRQRHQLTSELEELAVLRQDIVTGTKAAICKPYI